LCVSEARRSELRTAREEGALVSVAAVKAEWVEIGVRTRNQVLAIPQTICNRLPAEWRREVMSIATDEVRRALTTLSNEIRATKGVA
jgi:phage terminase Nu1 subunit (DNA packaging protein)